MNKQVCDLILKSFDETEGTFTGIATTPRLDSQKDVVIPKGAVFNLPLPLLAYHDKNRVIGTVEKATITDAGIEVFCRVLKGVTREATEAWALIVSGAMKGLSIGFRPLEQQPLSKGGYRFTKFEWQELSVVSVAINADARITAIKSEITDSKKGSTRMTISEQIRQFETKKAEVLANMDAMITKGVALSEDEDKAYKQYEADIESIDSHLDRLKAAETRQMKGAKAITGVPNISVESNLPKGVGFIAASKALMVAKGNPLYAAELAKQHYPNHPEIENFIRHKGPVGAATTTSQAALTTPGALASEFIALLQNAHIVGRLSGFRTIPHGVKIPRQSTAAAGYWMGEAAPIPLTTMGTNEIDIDRFKLAAIATMSNELLALGNPSIDALMRDAIIEAAAKESDLAFIVSTNAGSAVKPAAITNGLTAITTAGVGPQHVRIDVKAALDQFAIANQGIDGAVWIMHSVTASALVFMRTPAGAPAFPGMTIDGGTLLGLPVLVSNSVPGNSTDGYDLVLVKPTEIFRPQAPSIDIAYSTEASLEMLDSSLVSSGATGTGASLVSLFQNDMTAIRVIQFDGWYPRRTPCAVRIAGVKYDASVIESIAIAA